MRTLKRRMKLTEADGSKRTPLSLLSCSDSVVFCRCGTRKEELEQTRRYDGGILFDIFDTCEPLSCEHC